MADMPEPSTPAFDRLSATPPLTTPPARRVPWTKFAVGLGAAAVVAVGATAIAGAMTSAAPAASTSRPGSAAGGALDASGTSGSSGSASGTTPNTPPGGMGHGGGFGRGGFGGPGGGGFGGGFGGSVLHGQYTVQGPSGYETFEEQTGKVTAVSETDASTSTWSLTVTSADNTAITYVVDSGTNVDSGEIGISAVASGDTVDVTAVVSGSTDTAKEIQDVTKDQANRKSWAPTAPTPPSGSGSTAAPSSASFGASL